MGKNFQGHAVVVLFVSRLFMANAPRQFRSKFASLEKNLLSLVAVELLLQVFEIEPEPIRNINLAIAYFCLRPSAKDQGITCVVVVLVLVVHLLVQFVI